MNFQSSIERACQAFGIGSVVATTVLLMSVSFHGLGVFVANDNLIDDWQRMYSSKPASGQNVIVGIDQDTLAEYGGYPIDRRHIASVLEKLNEAGVRRVFVDLNVSNLKKEEDDLALEKAIEGLGPKKVALPAMLIEGASAKSDKSISTLLQPHSRFAKNATVVSADIPYDSDRLIRSVVTPEGVAGPPKNFASWPKQGEFATAGRTQVNFSVALDSIPIVSFAKVAKGDPAVLSGVKNKNVILGVVASNVIQTVPVPRYGAIERLQLLALAAETVQLHCEPRSVSLWVVALCTLVFVVPLGLYLSKQGLIKGILIVSACVVLLAICSLVLQQEYEYTIPRMMPLVAIVLTYIGAMLSTHPAFTGTRSAVQAFIGSVDHGLAKLFHTNIDSIVTFTPEGRILTMNQTAEKMFNLRAEQAIGKSLSLILPHSADKLLKAAAARQPGRLEATVGDITGMGRHVDLAFNSMPTESGWVGFASIRDISEFKAREEDLQRQATQDALTGLPNRRAFERHLDATFQYALQTGNPFAVFMLDLNKFKQVNDTLGHHIGDALLIEVAKRLKSTVRESDFVTRLGGDEFAVIMAPPTNDDTVESIASQMVSAIASIRELNGSAIETGTSIGIAYFPRNAESADELVQAADEAMYEAKRARSGYNVACLGEAMLSS